MVILPSKIRWSVIFLALIMMVSSVMISAHQVRKNDIIITKLQSNISRHNELIRSLWQDTALQENRLHMLALYTALTHDSDDKAVKDFARQYAQHIRPQASETMDMSALPGVLAELKDTKAKAIERIDHAFVEKLSWEEDISRLTQKNLFYMGLALFAQLLSVAAITIVRDMK